MHIVVIDIGGTNTERYHSDAREPRRTPPGPTLTPSETVAALRETVADWPVDVISIGHPGVVKDGRIGKEPDTLGIG